MRSTLTILFLLSLCVSSRAEEATPDEAWIPLFNGRDLTGWTPKIRGYDVGVNFGDTFRVREGLLVVAYDDYEDGFDGRFGHLFYDVELESYRLRIEYRFVGKQASGAPGWAFKNSGVMILGQSPQSMAREQSFPVSIEVQFLGGSEQGDRPTANLCTPGTHVVLDGKLDKRHCINSTAPTFRGDEWVTVEVLVDGGTVTHWVNGEQVMTYGDPQLDPADADAKKLLEAGVPAELRRGTISLQSESHPIEFRKVELQPLHPGVDFPTSLEADEGWAGVKGPRRAGDLYFSGQPTPEAFRHAKEAGVRTVINLRPDAEMASLDFDEPALLAELGMTYVQVPVTPGTYDREVANRVSDAIAGADLPVLVHCSSGNRVGGVYATYLVGRKGMLPADALRHGRAAGLRRESMIEAVKRLFVGD